jgi:hypothetical protein
VIHGGLKGLRSAPSEAMEKFAELLVSPSGTVRWTNFTEDIRATTDEMLAVEIAGEGAYGPQIK